MAIALLVEQPVIGAKHSGSGLAGWRRLDLSHGSFIDDATDEKDLKSWVFRHSGRENRHRL
jgi:hypothetical protein